VISEPERSVKQKGIPVMKAGPVFEKKKKT